MALTRIASHCVLEAAFVTSRFNFRWQFLRPFASLHASVPCVFVAILVLLSANSQCRANPHHEIPIFLAVLVTTAFWVAVYSTAAVDRDWRRYVKIACSVVYDVLCVFVLALPFFLLQPTYQCYTERAQVAEMLLVASTYRTAIAERALQRKTLVGAGVGMSVDPVGRLSSGTISANGVITVFSEDPRALIVLHPHLQGPEVDWSCEGFPLKAMPLSCRQLPYQTP